VRLIEIRTPFPLNLRQFALTDFQKSYDRKKLERGTKPMALVPSKSIHSLGFCEVWKVTRLKTKWEKDNFLSDFFPIQLEIAF